MVGTPKFFAAEAAHVPFDDFNEYGLPGVRAYDLPQLVPGTGYWVRRVTETFPDIAVMISFVEVLGLACCNSQGYVPYSGKPCVKVMTMESHEPKFRQIAQSMVAWGMQVDPEDVFFYGDAPLEQDVVLETD